MPQPSAPDSENVDRQVASGFGDEWTRFDQSAMADIEKRRIFEEYFGIFPWETVGVDAQGADFGCGSGRWATLVAPRVARLICVDASGAALEVARRNLRAHANCEFVEASIDVAPIPPGSLDFGYSLGVLHHIPDTESAMRACVDKLRPGAPFLVYLYYSFDNRPWWYRMIWRVSEAIRFTVSRMPYGLRYVFSQLVASLVYWPLARGGKLLGKVGLNASSFPLHYYQEKSFYVMRTDALDRFGTRLEQRFSRAQIRGMMERAGLRDIRFNERMPFWCAVGTRSAPQEY